MTTLLLVLLATTEFRPYEGPKPLVVWVQTNPWLWVIGSDTPRVVLYEDGELVLGKPVDHAFVYRHRRLQAAELAAFKERLRPVAAAAEIHPRYDLTGGMTDQPAALLYVRSREREIATAIEGLGARDSAPGKREPSDRADAGLTALLDLHNFLATLDEAGSVEWRPRYVEVMLWPFRAPGASAIRWPSDWPSLTSDRARKRHEDQYSIYLDGAMEPKVASFAATRSKAGGVEVGGRIWAISLRPVFPSEPIWRQAFERAPNP